MPKYVGALDVVNFILQVVWRFVLGIVVDFYPSFHALLYVFKKTVKAYRSVITLRTETAPSRNSFFFELSR